MKKDKVCKFDDKTWEKIDSIISYLVREENMNLAVDAGKVRDSIMALLIEIEDIKKSNIRTVKPCHDSMFNGIPCLENDEEFGFFKSETDIRPSSCTWIEKKDAQKLFKLFNK